MLADPTHPFHKYAQGETSNMGTDKQAILQALQEHQVLYGVRRIKMGIISPFENEKVKNVLLRRLEKVCILLRVEALLSMNE